MKCALVCFIIQIYSDLLFCNFWMFNTRCFEVPSTVTAVCGTHQHCGQYKVWHITAAHSLLLEDDTGGSLIYYAFPLRRESGFPQSEEIKKLKNIIPLHDDVIKEQQNRKRKLKFSKYFLFYK